MQRIQVVGCPAARVPTANVVSMTAGQTVSSSFSARALSFAPSLGPRRSALPGSGRRVPVLTARLSLARSIVELRAQARAKVERESSLVMHDPVLPGSPSLPHEEAGLKRLRRSRTISIAEEMRELVTKQRELDVLDGDNKLKEGASRNGSNGAPAAGSLSAAAGSEVASPSGQGGEQQEEGKKPWFGMTPRVRGLLLLNVLVVLMASNWSIVKQTGEVLDPFSFAFLRFGVAGLALTPFLAKALKNPVLVKAGLELGAWSAAGYLTQSLGLYYTDASRASFLSTFTVIVVPLISGFAGKGVKPFVWVSVFAALVGVGLLEQSGTAFGVGDIWSFLSAVFFGFQVYRTEVVSRAMPEKQTLLLMSIVMAVIAASAGVGAVATHPEWLVNMVSGGPWDMDAQIAAAMALPWLIILYTGLLSTDCALICEFEALQDVSSIEAALVYTLEPVLGAAFAWVLLGERWGPAGWVGAALIVGSSFATQVYGSDATYTDSPPQPETVPSGQDSSSGGQDAGPNSASKKQD